MSNCFVEVKNPNLISIKLGILAHDPLLQCRRPLRKSIHSHAILPRLSNTAYAHRLLGNDHNTRNLWNLVCGQRFLNLRARGQVLEPYPPWLLFKQAWSMVFECQYAHYHRSGHSDYSHPGFDCHRHSEEAEAGFDDHVCVGWFVSELSKSNSLR